MTDSQALVTVVAPSGGCISVAGAIVCRPRYLSHRIVKKCPTCDRRRRMVRLWEAWYGDTIYCLTCGDGWQDGEMMPRPWKPRWRQERIKHARELYAQALTADVFHASVQAEIDSWMADDDDAEEYPLTNDQKDPT